MLWLLSRRAETQPSDEIVRQQDPALKSTVEFLAQGQVSTALESLQQQGRVQIIEVGHRVRKCQTSRGEFLGLLKGSIDLQDKRREKIRRGEVRLNLQEILCGLDGLPLASTQKLSERKAK